MSHNHAEIDGSDVSRETASSRLEAKRYLAAAASYVFTSAQLSDGHSRSSVDLLDRVGCVLKVFVASRFHSALCDYNIAAIHIIALNYIELSHAVIRRETLSEQVNLSADRHAVWIQVGPM